MTLHRTPIIGALVGALLAVAPSIQAQQAETFTGTATVKASDGTPAQAPITVVVARLMPQNEADALTATFKKGGLAELRRALANVPPTGTIQVGSAAPTTTRLTIARITGDGRLLTIVADKPIAFIGANRKGAKPTAGFDFAVLDLSVDGNGAGFGTLLPAAKVTVNGNAFVVEDYGDEVVRVTGVTRK